MNDTTSESLYNKLIRIEEIKDSIRSTLYEIGGKEYFTTEPKFEEYANILLTIHSRISYVNRILDISVYGKEPDNAIVQEPSYSNILPYLLELQGCRSDLIANLNTKGVQADTNETLRELVAKVLDINGGEPIPPEPVPIYNELVRIAVYEDESVACGAIGYSYTNGSEEGIGIRTTIENKTNEVVEISLDDIIYVLELSVTVDGSTSGFMEGIYDKGGGTLSIPPQTEVLSNELFEVPINDPNYDYCQSCIDSIINGDYSARYYKTTNEVHKMIQVGESEENYLDLYLYELDTDYYLKIYNEVTENGDVYLDGYTFVYMLNAAETFRYQMYRNFSYNFSSDGKYKFQPIPLYTESESELFRNCKTNKYRSYIEEE